MESRAAALASLIVLAAALAGCSGGGDPAPPTTATSPSPQVAFTWSPGSPGAGESVVFEPHLRIVTGTTVAVWSWDFGDGGSSAEPTPSHAYAEAGAYTIQLRVTASDGGSGSALGDITVVAAGSGSGSGSKGSSHGGSTPPRDDPDDPPVELPPPPLPASTFLCPEGLVNETFATHGQAEGPEGRLSWAALRTGFRFVAVWESSAAEVGKLAVSVNGGPWQDHGDASARRVHAFVLDDLPTGGFLCFRASTGSAQGPVHAVGLANAMTNLGEDGVYTINLLVLANEGSDRPELEAGLRYHADLLWDATDGHVRAGAEIVLYDDLDHVLLGLTACGTITVGLSAICADAPDVVFSHDNYPFAAGATHLDDIQRPDGHIWMNALFEAPALPVFSGGEVEVGSVLTHELGHYAFGMQDMYTDLGTGPDCYDAGASVSIMGSNRDATEFDDEVNRCPNEELLSGYEPSWTSLRQRFDAVPDRAGAPDPGPEGDGGRFQLSTFDAGP